MKNPKIEALKEVGRWAILFVVSWFITATLDQIANVPEHYTFDVWVFSYGIPVRQLFTVGLTMFGRYADKFVHEKSKMDIETTVKGILPF